MTGHGSRLAATASMLPRAAVICCTCAMKVTVLLADKGTANPQQGTLNLLNVGWWQTVLHPAGPMVPGGFLTAPHAVAVFLELEHQYCNRPTELVLSLVDEDGRAVQVPGPGGGQELRIAQQITVSSPAGVPIGTPGRGTSMIEIVPGLAVGPGGYEWIATFAGEHRQEWGAQFRVLPPVQPPDATIGTPPVPPQPS